MSSRCSCSSSSYSSSSCCSNKCSCSSLRNRVTRRTGATSRRSSCSHPTHQTPTASLRPFPFPFPCPRPALSLHPYRRRACSRRRWCGARGRRGRLLFRRPPSCPLRVPLRLPTSSLALGALLLLVSPRWRPSRRPRGRWHPTLTAGGGGICSRPVVAAATPRWCACHCRCHCRRGRGDLAAAAAAVLVVAAVALGASR